MGTTGHAATEEGLRLLRSGRVGEAIKTLARVTSADPNDARARMYLGIACCQAGDSLRAAQHLEESIRLQ